MGKSFFMNVAKVSGIFKSEYIIELSSKVIIIELSEPRMSPVIPLYPRTPLKGAVIFLSLSLKIEILQHLLMVFLDTEVLLVTFLVRITQLL